jgi:hypothetical protein
MSERLWLGCGLPKAIHPPFRAPQWHGRQPKENVYDMHNMWHRRQPKENIYIIYTICGIGINSRCDWTGHEEVDLDLSRARGTRADWLQEFCCLWALSNLAPAQSPRPQND